MTDLLSYSTLRAPLASALIGVSLMSGGCARIADDAIDDFFDSFELTGPVELEVEAESELDASRIKVGLLPKTALATMEIADGELEEQWVHLRVSTTNDGRVRLADQWTEDDEGVRAEDRFGGIARVQPLGTVTAESQIDFQLPEDAPVNETYTLIVWYDADDDGRLQISQDDDSEYVRVFRGENDGQEFMLTDLTHYASDEEPSDIWWSGNAVHESTGEGDERFNQHIDDQWSGSTWAAAVRTDLEAPLD